MSRKLNSRLRAKYSSAILRPPITASAPSAMNSLLCIRWLMRWKSASEAKNLVEMLPRAQQKGLNSRTSTLGKAVSSTNSASLPAV